MHRTVPLVVAIAALVAVPVTVHGHEPTAHTAAVCAAFPNQAAAQRAHNTRDADGDGIYCEDLPCPCSTAKAGSGGGTSSLPKPSSGTSCVKPAGVQSISFSKTKYPNIRRHRLRALAKGWPRTLVLNRPGASARRAKLLEDVPTRPGFDRDEYPPAEARGKGPGLTRGINPTGWRADVAYVPSHENRSHGATMEAELRRFCNGTKFRDVFY